MNPAPPLVVDTSVAVKWFFDEPYTPEALKLFEAIRDGAYRALAPDLMYAEFTNAVWKRVVGKGLSPEDGAAIITAFARLPLEIAVSLPILLPAYGLAVEHGTTVYDALFVSLSVESGADLVTADEPLYRAVHPRLPQVRWIGSWPRS